MHTVIVGGGFAGVKAALELSRLRTGRITLISQEPHFLYHASLYATVAGHNAQQTTIPLEDIFAEHPAVTIVHDTITQLRPDLKKLKGKKATYAYDTLILALGAVHSTYGVAGVDTHCYKLRTKADVEKLQKQVASRKKTDTITIIGGGPTGVELAGILADTARQYHNEHARIILIERGDRLLPLFSRTASGLVLRRLRELGVDVRLSTTVQDVQPGHVALDNGVIVTRTAVWTAGEANHPFYDRHAAYFTIGDDGRVVVNSYLQALPDVYVIGDNASVSGSGFAPSALRMGAYAARHIAHKMQGKMVRPYRAKRVTHTVPVGETWAYTEQYGIYACGWLGFIFRRQFELSAYKALLSPAQARAAWHAYFLPRKSTKKGLRKP